MAACASSEDPGRYKDFGPFDLNFELIEYDNLKVLEEHFKSDPNIAAYMLEPIQGERGVIIPSSGYLKGVKQLCEKYNVLMICDEVQTGMGRTGKMFAHQYEAIKPDILILGKALSGGLLPVSAVFADDIVMKNIYPGEHGSTYGGNSMACVVAREAVQTLIDEKMVENSERMGQVLLKNLQTFTSFSCIKEARGRGLFCALEFHEQKDRKLAYEFSQRLL